ncbi:hypothetical protein F4808DRAFT_456874 [Astrocystis sublimbata]|nr:hypothetical protein F4808DRAFT_456874 [Astrocystis sublimbata]
MLRINHILLLFLGILASLAAASSAPLFCKCTCFKNSTLIQLSSGDSQASCAQCTHAFCLAQNLPICKDATPGTEDVLSTCIQRDSRKDQIIVWAFLLGTAGLLAWAAAKRVEDMRRGKKNPDLPSVNSHGNRNRAGDADTASYAPVPPAAGR